MLQLPGDDFATRRTCGERRTPGRRRIRAGDPQVQLALPGRQPLPATAFTSSSRPSRCVDIPRPAPGGPHDLDCGRPDTVFAVRTYATRRDNEPQRNPPLSAQIREPATAN